MRSLKFIKFFIVFFLVVQMMFLQGFMFLNDPDTSTIPYTKGKIITLAYLDASFILNLEDICTINSENKITADEAALRKKIEEIAHFLNRDTADARIMDEKSFTIQKETIGEFVEEYQLYELIKNYIETGSVSENETIPIPVIQIKPLMTEEILSQIKKNEISSFSTSFNPKITGRTENLRISTEVLNGIVIYPGDILSMDELLGERTVEKGYKNAPAFSGGKVVISLAGGICQTTTTLYNAALLANMEIVERHKHGLPVSYIGKGRDATIYRNVYDLKIRNNEDLPLYIKSSIDIKKGLLTVKIFGYEKKFTVKITTEHQKKNGISYYKTYRHLYDLNNKFIKTELISTDIFK